MGISPILLGTLIASTAATVGTSIYSAVSAPKPPATPDTAQQEAQASQAAALAQANALTKRRGMASTILTNPMGTAQTKGSALGA